MNPEKKLKRNLQNQMIAGVCSGLADYFEIDIALTRVIFLLVTFFSLGLGGILLYVLLSVIMSRA